jgi:hypothetical protein
MSQEPAAGDVDDTDTALGYKAPAEVTIDDIVNADQGGGIKCDFTKVIKDKSDQQYVGNV